LLSGGFGPLGGITTGPDGEIWFLEKDRLGRIDPATGLIQEFAQGISTGSEDFAGRSIAEGPDGSIWFVSNHQLTRFTPRTNALDTFNLSSNSMPLDSFAIGADGAVWVLEEQPTAFGLARLDPATGGVQNYAVGQLQPWGMSMSPLAVGIAPDGKIWIAIWNSPVEVMDPSTGVVNALLPASSSGPAPVLPASSGTSALPLSSSTGSAAGFPASLATVFQPPEPAWATGDIISLGDEKPVSVQPATLAPPPALLSYYHSYAIPPKVASDGSYWDLLSTGIPFAGSYDIRGYDPSTGKSTLFPLDGAPIQLTPGSDGNIWFTDMTAGIYEIGELNPTTGAIDFFVQATPSQAAPPSTGNPPPATGTTVSALAGINFLGAVASFTPQIPIASPGQAYQATIAWGDGTTSSLVLMVTASGTYDVTAGHTYQTAGTYSIKVTIGNYNPANPLGDNVVTVFSTANVDPFNMNM
jgi:streptogramin lyase